MFSLLLAAITIAIPNTVRQLPTVVPVKRFIDCWFSNTIVWPKEENIAVLGESMDTRDAARPTPIIPSASAGWTKSGAPVGTPLFVHYPSVRCARKASIASTVCFCCSSAEMTAGRSPFCGGTLALFSQKDHLIAYPRADTPIGE